MGHRRPIRGRIDDNQRKVVEDLRKAGCSVAVTSAVGGGFGDIVVGKDGRNFIVEIKDPKKPHSGRQLNPDEKDFHASWRGQICVIETAEDLLGLIP